MNITRKKINHVILYILFIIVTVGYAFPLLFGVATALKTKFDILAMPPKFLFVPTLENFRSIFSKYNLWPALLNSIIVSSSTTFLALLIGTPSAYVFSRYTFKGKKLIFFWILSSRMIPQITLVLPYFLIARKFGLYDTRIYLIFVYLEFNLPLVVWMMTSFFKDIPIEISDAAMMDGCSHFGVLTRIFLPLCAPGLVATAIFCLIFAWNEFMFALSLTEYHAYTMPLSIVRFMAYTGTLWGEICAASIIVIIPVLIVVYSVQQYMIKGLTLGAIK